MSSRVEARIALSPARGRRPRREAAGARDFDSSEPAATDVSYGVPLLGGLALFIVGGVVVLTLRR